MTWKLGHRGGYFRAATQLDGSNVPAALSLPPLYGGRYSVCCYRRRRFHRGGFMHRIGSFAVCLGAFCLADATPVAADPVSITSGFLLVTGPNETGSISIAGTQGFSLDAVVTPSEGRVDAIHLECDPICLPGSTISLGASLGGPAFSGTATLAGDSFHLPGTVEAPASILLEFFGTATLPGLQSSLIVTAPFNAMGWFNLPSGSQTLMSGAGVASVWLSESPYTDLPRAWVVDQIRYDFGAPAPIPEPATLSLLGIGLAATALGARAHRKEKRRQPEGTP